MMGSAYEGQISNLSLSGRSDQDRPLLREHVIAAVAADGDGNAENLDGIVAVLLESEAAKHHLRSKGYGVTGTSILATAWEVPEAGR